MALVDVKTIDLRGGSGLFQLPPQHRPQLQPPVRPVLGNHLKTISAVHTINPSNCVIAQKANVVLRQENVGADECDAVSAATKRFDPQVFLLPPSCRWRRQIPTLAQAERRQWHCCFFDGGGVVPSPNLSHF